MHCTNYSAVIEIKTYSEHCQTFKMDQSVKNTKKDASQQKKFKVFSPI